MKRKVFFLGCFFAMALTIACSKTINPNELSFSDFKENLKATMTYNEIVSNFGEPATDIGSGIHIYVYQLTDSSQVWIGYTDKILYARHMDQNKQLIESII